MESYKILFPQEGKTSDNPEGENVLLKTDFKAGSKEKNLPL